MAAETWTRKKSYQLHALAANITEVHRDSLLLHNGSTSLQARALPRLLPRFLHELAADELSLAVGDWGLLCGTAESGYSFIARMPALTHLARRNNEGRLQALASNIDTALLVMGLDNDTRNPPLPANPTRQNCSKDKVESVGTVCQGKG